VYCLHNKRIRVLSPKRLTESPNDIIKRLIADGWSMRKGKDDHVNFTKPGVRYVVTIDTGVREIPVGTLRSIYRLSGWDW
jgi:predicted RNA binding protein YcfA (HicA-like mRNA interferase family)